jgi:hypothetical protein
MSTIEPNVTEVNQLQALAEDSDPHPQSDQPAARPRPAQTQPPVAEQAEPVEDRAKEDMEILTPTERSKQWVIGKDDLARTYVQRELSVIGKAQWFSLVGNTLDEALSGENKLSLNSLLTPPQIQPGQPVLQQFADADTFVHAVGKLLSVSPDFISKSICIWLDVPDYEWDLVATLMRMSPEDGGLSDDDFESMFAHFIDQNYMSIERFFRERFPRLRARLQARRNETPNR